MTAARPPSSNASGRPGASSRPTFSVIVPALDEEDEIVGALESAARALGPDAELIVVDGGSADRTAELAGRLARVVPSPPGRGRQLQSGAEAATGRVLLFLHADTRLDPNTGQAIRALLRDSRVVGGCSRFGVRPKPDGLGAYRWLELGINGRTRALRTATGDQAIFVTRTAFERLEGIGDYPLFEDVALVRGLRRLGRFQSLPSVARTSRRRWERSGFWRTVVVHWLLRVAFWMGVRPARLAEWYDRFSGR